VRDGAQRLGSRQFAALSFAIRLGLLLGPKPDRVERSLLRRGLLKRRDDGLACITPKGLRALADAVEEQIAQPGEDSDG